MKKLIALLCAATMVLSLAACSSKEETTEETTPETSTEETTPEETTENPVQDMELSDLMAGMLTDVVDLPMVGDMPLDESNFEMFAFIPYVEGYEALASEAMIGSIAHSVVLLRVPAEDAEDVAADILANANPRKWICVEAEKVLVRQYGDTIALIMSAEQTANQIVTNLDTLNGSETPEEDIYDPNAPVDDPADDMEGLGDMDDMGGDLGPAVAPLPDENLAVTQPSTTTSPDLPMNGQEEIPAVAPEVVPETVPEVVPETEEPAGPPMTAPEGVISPADQLEGEEPEEEVIPESNGMSAVMDSIMSGVQMEIMTGNMELNEENFTFYSFLEMGEGYKAVVNEAMMNAQAHSVVLVEVPEGTDVAQVASTMKANANPAKWVCVEAETCEVATNGNYILLVMTYADYADAIVASFANI